MISIFFGLHLSMLETFQDIISWIQSVSKENKGIVVCAHPIFCFLCSCLLLFSIAAHFHLAGR